MMVMDAEKIRKIMAMDAEKLRIEVKKVTIKTESEVKYVNLTLMSEVAQILTIDTSNIDTKPKVWFEQACTWIFAHTNWF
jgi:hypothetical protein